MADLGDRRLYLCVPDRPDLEWFVASCIAGGVDLVQLREKELDDRRLLARAELVRRVCAEAQVPFVMNDRPDLALAAGADGVHVGQDDVPPAVARRIVGDDAIVGLSTHAQAQLLASLDEPVDYVSAGPVAPTPTKPGRPGVGLDYVRFAVGRASRPVFVTGGASPATVAGIVGAGARRVVAVRWLTEAPDPEAAARLLRRTLDAAIAEAEAGEAADPSPG